MALSALCGDDEWGRSWAEIMQYRFTSEGPLNGHAVGNLILAALWDRDLDIVAGLDRVGALLKVVGRVLPMSQIPLDIEGTFTTVDGIVTIRGQKEVATTKGRLQSLRLIPEDAKSLPQSLAALQEADWITMGPGSWFSSVLPHLLLPEQRDAISQSAAKKILLMNLDGDSSAENIGEIGEYAGYTHQEHLSILHEYAPDLRFDYVVVDQSTLDDEEGLRSHLSSKGSELVVGDLRNESEKIHHDVKKLTSLFAHIKEISLVG